jgi:hypothetical protein
MGTLNSRVQRVQTPIAGVALSHLRILRLRSGIVISFGKNCTSGVPVGIGNFKTEAHGWDHCGLVDLRFAIQSDITGKTFAAGRRA